MRKMNQRSKVINIALLAVWCFSLFTNISLAAISPEELQKMESAMPAKATVAPKQPRKLLVFTLCEGFVHSSIPYATKALEIMGKKTGAFEVVQSEDMSLFKPENLKQFDAVCFNNSTRLEFKDSALQQSLMDFVKGGKGIIGIHAAADNFYDWPEAAEMMGSLFDGHPWHELVGVKLDDPAHPLCAVFKGRGFEIKEEIYQFKAPYSREKLRVLLSIDTSKTNMNKDGIKRTDNDFAISWVRSWSKGRVFYCSLGHRHEIFWNPVVLQHYLDGIQFAMGDLPADTTPSAQLKSGAGAGASGLDAMLAKIATYNYGQSREPLTELTDFIGNAYDSPQLLERIEKRLLEFLRSDATLAGKQFICRQLSIIGTEEAVPTLAEMLTEAETSDMARYALERIPGDVVDEALRKALLKTTGKIRVGIINSLGQRGDRMAVKPLSKLLLVSDYQCASAAAAALGKIGGKKATAHLKKMLKKASSKWRVVLADAYLMCADKFLDEDDTKSALAIYKQLYAPDELTPIRIAALKGIVTARGEEAVGIVVDTLKRDDPELQTAAIGLVREIPGTEIIEAASAELPKLFVTGQVQLLSALADKGDPIALAVVVDATKSTEDSVRIAALSALTALGDTSTVDLLAQAAAKTTGAEREAARESLYRLRGPDVDATIMANIQSANPEVKVELIYSIEQRRIYAATKTLLKTAKDSDSKVCLESLKALKVVADQEHLPVLLELLISAQSEAERNEAEKTVAVVARKIPDENRRADAVLTVLGSVEDVTARCSLLSVLSKIGDDNGLAVLRKALEDSSADVQIAAIRALSDWPSDKPMDDLLRVVKQSDNEIHRVLALRGYIRLIGLDSDRPAEKMIKMYQEAMSLASNVSEKKMVLSGLANIKSFAALYMASVYLEDDALQQEAGAAMVKIAQTTRDSHPQQTKILLKMVIQTSKSGSLREQAQKMLEQIK